MQLYELARPRSLLLSGFHSSFAAVQHSHIRCPIPLYALHAWTSTTSSELVVTTTESRIGCAEKRGNVRRFCLLGRCKSFWAFYGGLMITFPLRSFLLNGSELCHVTPYIEPRDIISRLSFQQSPSVSFQRSSIQAFAFRESFTSQIWRYSQPPPVIQSPSNLLRVCIRPTFTSLDLLALKS